MLSEDDLVAVVCIYFSDIQGTHCFGRPPPILIFRFLSHPVKPNIIVLFSYILHVCIACGLDFSHLIGSAVCGHFPSPYVSIHFSLIEEMYEK